MLPDTHPAPGNNLLHGKCVMDVDRGASKHELEKSHWRCLIRIQFSHHGAGSDAIKVVEEAYVTLQDPTR